MSPHRYSGWPGAWCLDCGQEDPWEVALADGYDPYSETWPSEEVRLRTEDALNVPCPCPGAGHFDPYRRMPKQEE